MKTIVVKTEKVVSLKDDMTPVIEEITQKIGPELTFFKFVKYLPNQGYKSANVVKVIDDGKEVDEIKHYQAMIDESLSGKLKQVKDRVNYKELAEKQAEALEDMKKRLEALESTKSEMIEQSTNSQYRIDLEAKAYELGISFRSNIGDAKLLEKIQEVEPDFNIE